MPTPKAASAKPKADAYDVPAALASLERIGTKRTREGLARYGITTKDKTFGVAMGDIQKLAKKLGRNHAFADALWKTGVYEGRMLAIYVAEPARVTPAQMDRWVRDFDNWAVCDTVCFKLFDQTPHAHAKIAQWAKRREEFIKRAAFALLASIALHDKKAANEPFLRGLVLIESAAGDDRNFVKKGVSWALRGIGMRNAELKTPATEVAERLSTSHEPAARWVGKDALRALTKR